MSEGFSLREAESLIWAPWRSENRAGALDPAG
jgi:hypothetical protein